MKKFDFFHNKKILKFQCVDDVFVGWVKFFQNYFLKSA